MRKSIIYNLYRLLLPAMLLGACSHGMDECNEANDTSSARTYRMQLDAVCHAYEGTTRSAVRWDDGSMIYLRFHEPAGDVTGVATYNDEEETWEITPSRALELTDESSCQALYFVNPVSQTSARASLSAQSVIYIDTAATYMFYDNLLIVHASMFPKTGRIRFKGSEGREFAVSGMSYYSEYSFASNSFVSKQTKISSKTAADGYSPFYYTFFTNENDRTLVFDYTRNAAFKSTFDAAVLKAGTSGAVSIPTYDNPMYWILVNKENLEEILLPEISGVNVKSVRSVTAILSTKVLSLGNGSIQQAGFLYSTSAAPSVENGTLALCDSDIDMQLYIKGLTPETTYYAKAFVTNEKGTTWSDVIEFTTISKSEDKSNLDKEEYGNDDDLNDHDSSDGTIGKEGYGDDDDLNDHDSSDGTIGKDEYGDDDDLNDHDSSGGTIGKDEYGDDDDLNDHDSSGGTIGKDEYGDDDDLNDHDSSDGTIGKDEFGNDESLN